MAMARWCLSSCEMFAAKTFALRFLQIHLLWQWWTRLLHKLVELFLSETDWAPIKRYERWPVGECLSDFLAEGRWLGALFTSVPRRKSIRRACTVSAAWHSNKHEALAWREEGPSCWQAPSPRHKSLESRSRRSRGSLRKAVPSCTNE